jgi:hypothetical protein
MHGFLRDWHTDGAEFTLFSERLQYQQSRHALFQTCEIETVGTGLTGQ